MRSCNAVAPLVCGSSTGSLGWLMLADDLADLSSRSKTVALYKIDKQLCLIITFSSTVFSLV